MLVVKVEVKVMAAMSPERPFQSIAVRGKKLSRKSNGARTWARDLEVMTNALRNACWGNNIRWHAHQAVEELLKYRDTSDTSVK